MLETVHLPTVFRMKALEYSSWAKAAEDRLLAHQFRELAERYLILAQNLEKRPNS